MTFISERNKEQRCFGTKLEKVSLFETKSRKSGKDFGEDLFFLENTINFGQKVRKMELISSDDFLFFGEQHGYRIITNIR